MAGLTLGGNAAVAQPAPSIVPAPIVEGLDIEIGFDKDTYLTGEEVVATATITNTTDAPIDHVIAYPAGKDGVHFTGDAGEFNWNGSNPSGGTLDAHETVEIDFFAHIGNVNATKVELLGYIGIKPDGPGLPLFPLAEAKVEKRTGYFAGTVYADRNGNEKFDDGEALAGAKVTASNPYFQDDRPETTTDAAGRFRMDNVATVPYLVFVEEKDGWTFQYQPVAVDTTDANANLLFGGVGHFDKSLTASIAFTKQRYQVGDTAEMKVTLKNTGTVALAGIKANCDRIGGSPDHVGWGEKSWGELGFDGAGAKVGGGETKVITVSGVVPAGAGEYGMVRVSCDFGFDGSNNPQADAWAFAGEENAVGSVSITAFANKPGGDEWHQDGEELPGLDVSLIDVTTKKIVVTVKADAKGKAAFTDIPVGAYDIAFSDGWVRKDTRWDFRITKVCPYGCDSFLEVVKSANPQPTPTTTTTAAPVTTTTAVPAAQGKAASGDLPNTGASVVWPAIAGLSAVVLGGFAVFVTRRRKKTVAE
ncbi:LPXTG cell wall anchor domain-containing protein [Actinokineospora sp.]|uniref:LPXTG cell wall anchor domain-containing protein n=1 Tax=Actinokineospora sp. TaxID=1872133 RepID=UPI003D6AD76B